MLSLTFADMAVMEPELQELLDEAKRVSVDRRFCRNHAWYSYLNEPDRFKNRMLKLVGFNSQSKAPLMHTSEAYDLAYKTIYEVLPPCQHVHPCC